MADDSYGGDDVEGREGDGKSGVDCEMESGGEKDVDGSEGERGGDGAGALKGELYSIV